VYRQKALSGVFFWKILGTRSLFPRFSVVFQETFLFASGQAFKEQNSLQVIVLVLDNPCQNTVGIQREGVPLPVKGLYGNRQRPSYVRIDSGNAQAPLFIEAVVGRNCDNAGVDKDPGFVVGNVHDKETAHPTDLGTGEPYPFGVVHQRHHFIGQPGNVTGDVIDGLYFLLESFIRMID
jgi:hypothetical protein